MTPVRTLCVYCGSRVGRRDSHADTARALGQRMAGEGISLVFGGGRMGIMGILAGAVLAAGGRVTGIIPDHLQQTEPEHEGLTELIVVDSMHTRKRKMFERADGFIILPGGLGTLDETFEIITWKQLGLHAKPIVIADFDGYWSPLLELLEHLIDEEFAGRQIRELYSVARDVDDIFRLLAEAPVPGIAPQPDRI